MKIYVILFSLFINEIQPYAYDVALSDFVVLPESKPSYIDFGTVRIKRMSAKEFVLSGSFHLYKQVTSHGILTLTIHRMLTKGKDIKVYSKSGPYCEEAAKDKLIYPQLLEHSNLPKEICPLLPGNYTINDLVYHLDNMNTILPPGNYRGTATYTVNGDIKIGCSMMGTLSDAKKKQ